MTLSERTAALAGPDRAVDAEVPNVRLLEALTRIAAIADSADKFRDQKGHP